MREKLVEAERRIEKARRTQAEWLDLGDLALSELPAKLGNLLHLKALYLGTLRPIAGGEVERDGKREPARFTNLAPLAGLQRLQRLDLQFCQGVMDLAPLAGLKALQSLDLRFCQSVTNLAPLAGLKVLQILDLAATDVANLIPLAGLEALQILDLRFCQNVTDLVPLAGLKALQILRLSSTGVTDLAPLVGLQELQTLELRFCWDVTDFHGLWQKSQADADLMAERLVPVILPEVQITRPRDRASYMRYWREQKEELEELLRELGPDLDPETFREVRLIRSFSQDVDGILRFVQDVLMPRNLEAHLDDGFQAVRDALRRRMESS